MSMRFPGGLIATSPVNANYPSGVWTQAQAIPYQAQNVWTRDRYWPYTTLLLQGNGTNGAQNNTFLDSSTNNFTITRNGNTTQGSFTPYEPTGYWSNVAVPNGSNAITTTYPGLSGTGDYTVSFWIYLNSWTGGDNNGSDGGFVYIYGQGASHPTYPFAVRITKAGKVVVVDSVNFGPTWESTFDYAGSYNTANSIGLNRWNYIHIVRSSGTLSIYANGGLQLSVSQASAMAAPYTNGTINDINGFDGYISNFRIATTAITNATPPTGPSSASGAVLLTCASNRFQDLTGTYTVTPSGSASVQSFQPFPGATTYSGTVLGGSGYFDGSGDTLSTSGGNVSGTGAFTVEFWIYPIATGSQQLIYGDANTGSLYIYFFGDNLLHVSNYNIANQFVSIPTTRNSWNHVVVVRDSSGNYSVFINGARAGTLTGNTTNYASMSTVRVGGEASQRFIGGYMSDVRVSTNAALYNPTQTTITVPTAPLTAVANTNLLLNFTNAGISDAATMNDLETVGNAQVSTSVVKYGTGSMYFDGSGDWLLTRTSPNLDLGTGDFTFECWLYITNTIIDYRMLVSDATNGNNYITLRGGGTGGQVEVNVNGTSFRINLNNSISQNVWAHFAVVRTGSTFTAYVNGVSLGTGSSSAAFNLGNGGMYVGRFGGATAYEWPGYIDDLRITKGAARYIGNFTPPPARMPGQ